MDFYALISKDFSESDNDSETRKTLCLYYKKYATVAHCIGCDAPAISVGVTFAIKITLRSLAR